MQTRPLGNSRRGRRIVHALIAAAGGALLSEGLARAGVAPPWLDPRAFGVSAGRMEKWFGVPVGVVGIACTVAATAIRVHHSPRWVRRWLVVAAVGAPLLIVGIPLVAGVIASHYVSGDHFADIAMVAATRYMALAAAGVWLVWESMAAGRQHEHDLYAYQRPLDRWARVMRRAAAVFGAGAAIAFVAGLTAALMPQ